MNARTKALYDQARKGLAQGNLGNWAAAEAMAALYEAGESMREIAAGLEVGISTVQRYVKVWSVSAGNRHELPFAEALGATIDRSAERVGSIAIPKAPERRAELAAELLKDKLVYEQPVVKKAVDRHVDRQLRQAVTAARETAGVPTRTEHNRDRRRLSVVVNRMFWRDLLWALDKANRMLNEAAGELERTGLPQGQSGDIIRAVRNLAKTADRFAATAEKRVIGEPVGA